MEKAPEKSGNQRRFRPGWANRRRANASAAAETQTDDKAGISTAGEQEQTGKDPKDTRDSRQQRRAKGGKSGPAPKQPVEPEVISFNPHPLDLDEDVEIPVRPSVDLTYHDFTRESVNVGERRQFLPKKRNAVPYEQSETPRSQSESTRQADNEEPRQRERRRSRAPVVEAKEGSVSSAAIPESADTSNRIVATNAKKPEKTAGTSGFGKKRGGHAQRTQSNQTGRPEKEKQSKPLDAKENGATKAMNAPVNEPVNDKTRTGMWVRPAKVKKAGSFLSCVRTG